MATTSLLLTVLVMYGMSTICFSNPVERSSNQTSFPFDLLTIFKKFENEMKKGMGQLFNGDDELLAFSKDEFNSTDKGLSISIDVSSFSPSEVNVTVDGNDLVVQGSHDETSNNSTIHRQFVRRYRIPDDVDASHLKSSFSKTGKLTIEVPKKNSARAGKKTKTDVDNS